MRRNCKINSVRRKKWVCILRCLLLFPVFLTPIQLYLRMAGFLAPLKPPLNNLHSRQDQAGVAARWGTDIHVAPIVPRIASRTSVKEIGCWRVGGDGGDRSHSARHGALSQTSYLRLRLLPHYVDYSRLSPMALLFKYNLPTLALVLPLIAVIVRLSLSSKPPLANH